MLNFQTERATYYLFDRIAERTLLEILKYIPFLSRKIVVIWCFLQLVCLELTSNNDIFVAQHDSKFTDAHSAGLRLLWVLSRGFPTIWPAPCRLMLLVDEPNHFFTSTHASHAPCILMTSSKQNHNFKNHMFAYTNPDPNPYYLFSLIVVRIYSPNLCFW